MGDLFRQRAKLDHYPEVIVHDPMLYKLVILHAIDVDVLDGEGVSLRSGDARKIEPGPGAPPDDVAHDQIAEQTPHEVAGDRT
jgi:hypothetical protein